MGDKSLYRSQYGKSIQGDASHLSRWVHKKFVDAFRWRAEDTVEELELAAAALAISEALAHVDASKVASRYRELYEAYRQELEAEDTSIRIEEDAKRQAREAEKK